MPVLDASALAGWLMPDEEGLDLAPLFEAAEPVVAPKLLEAELVSILVVAERRGRLSAPEANALISAVARLEIVFDAGGTMAAVAKLARAHGLSAYDATYLEVALRRGMPLHTLEARLAAAARAAGVAVP